MRRFDATPVGCVIIRDDCNVLPLSHIVSQGLEEMGGARVAYRSFADLWDCAQEHGAPRC